MLDASLFLLRMLVLAQLASDTSILSLLLREQKDLRELLLVLLQQQELPLLLEFPAILTCPSSQQYMSPMDPHKPCTKSMYSLIQRNKIHICLKDLLLQLEQQLESEHSVPSSLVVR